MKFDLRLRWNYAFLVLILFIGAFFCVNTLSQAYTINNGFGFPLDDSWIHLQFARNLHDYGAFSYYKNEMTTAGSTSPLYTILLAVGFFFTSNEFLLSYTLGIGALVLGAFGIYKLASVLLKNDMILPLAAALLFILEPRLQWAALAGMETTLFIALLLGALYFYYTKKPVLLGIAGGLLVWARPDAVILFLVIAADVLYELYVVYRPTGKKRRPEIPMTDFSWIRKSFIYTFAITIIYCALNMYLSGSILPNTYAAKLKYYSAPGETFPSEVFHFLSEGHFSVFSIFAAISVLAMVWRIFKRRSTMMLIPLGWSLLLFIAYWKNLPKLYQNGRYLIPLLPCFLLLGLDGMRRVLNGASHWFPLIKKPFASMFATLIIVLAFAAQFGITTLSHEKDYIDGCRYITERQVKTGFWLRDNLPQNAVVATHDIGAIAFYSNRRIVDMVGLVSPGMIDNIGSLDLLMKFLIRNSTTHIALLRNWFEIVNINPLFQTDPIHPEIMQVFQFDPGRTHFTPQDATKLNDAGERYLAIGNASYAMQIFRQSFFKDPQSARTNFLLGKTARALGDGKTAMERFVIVNHLQPDFPGLAGQIEDLRNTNIR